MNFKLKGKDGKAKRRKRNVSGVLCRVAADRGVQAVRGAAGRPGGEGQVRQVALRRDRQGHQGGGDENA